MTPTELDPRSAGNLRRARRELIGDALARSVRRNPAREALRFEAHRWTYAELDAAANRVAHRLLALGLETGDRVAAYGRNSVVDDLPRNASGKLLKRELRERYKAEAGG